MSASESPAGPSNPTPNPGRDNRGRFAKGNPGGPGNPFARRVGALRSILIETVSDDDLRDVARAIIDKAKSGDMTAAKLLLQYTIGKPSEAIDPDRLDVEEMALFQQEACTAEQIAPVFKGVAASTAVGLFRAVVPALASEHIKFAQRGLADPPAAPAPQPAPAANPDRPPSSARTATKRPERQPTTPAQPLPSVQELRRMIATSPLGVETLCAFLDEDAQEPSTVTKPDQTACRCANDGP